MTPQRLPDPPSGDEDLHAWVMDHLGDLCAPMPGGVTPPMHGGQRAADAALQAYDVRGYARLRNNVWPPETRGASRLSPYIRHGLLSLREVWDHVAGGPPSDVTKFRDELLWQEYARHLYARMGTASRASLRFDVEERTTGASAASDNPWSSAALCLDSSWTELTSGGWLTNQTRMWLASHWNVREGLGWRDGEDLMYRHLLDGSRAANRLGWQWTVGALTGKAYGFSRWQVQKRAPGMCARCPLQQRCPIEDWPPAQEREPRALPDPRLRRDDDLEVTAGPTATRGSGDPEAVWMTAESLGDRDPAAAAHPGLPVVFVFDEPLLRRLRLSGNRVVFLAQSLAELATRREVHLWRGSPVAVLQGTPLAATFAPVPGWRSRAARLDVVALHPWPWLRRPSTGSVASYSAWRKAHT
ncbi:MAG: deoxyribodipyrimidine photolyase [Actinomycetota bacterium]|nr:deoxyribodipyrimidine photolyase [Actinomycetota bacterium]MDA2948473.1 deoxyribodipyrimidine photolyase [Actinomycetota bacterium]